MERHWSLIIDMKLLLPFFLVITLCSCSKQSLPTINKDISLFVFIISDNNLDDYSDYIEKDFVHGLKGCPVGTEMFLYIDRLNQAPSLRHLTLLESGDVAIRKTWYFEEQCSTSSEVFCDVLSTMVSCSSGNQYGLFYWSHGDGWLPGLSSDEDTKTIRRSIGLDGVYSMNVGDMAKVLIQNKLPLFMVLDACYMGSVEVAYELRNATQYLIASSAETLGVCFPYHIIIPELINGTKQSMIRSLDSYLKWCYTDYYQDGQISGMASLVDCSQLDSLALLFHKVLQNNNNSLVELDSIQSFDGSTNHMYYDLGQYVTTISEHNALLDAFEEQLKRTVIYKVYTPSIYNSSIASGDMIEVKHYSGLSTYILGTNSFQDGLYSRTGWYKFCYDQE